MKEIPYKQPYSFGRTFNSICSSSNRTRYTLVVLVYHKKFDKLTEVILEAIRCKKFFVDSSN